MFHHMITKSSEIKQMTALTFAESQPESGQKEFADRFFSAAAMLPAGTLMGLQISFDGDGKLQVRLFSDSDVSLEDVAWIVGDAASAVPEDASALPEDCPEGRWLYGMSMTGSRSSRHFCLPLSRVSGPATIRILKESDAILQILAGPGQGEGPEAAIFLSLDETIPLRLRTVLAVMMPSAEALDLAEGRPVSPIHEEGVRQFTTYLIQMVNDALDEARKSSFVPGSMEDMSLEDLGLTVRSYNCLKRAGIHTLGDLRKMSDRQLLAIRNFGRKNLDEIHGKLIEMSLMSNVYEDIDIDDWDEDDNEKVPEQKARPDCRASLDEMVGLAEVKEQIRRITALARMKKDMADSGMDALSINLSMAFVGNPGTAKTSVARILAGIFHEIGLLESDTMIEVGRADLVGKYVGHTADKVKALFRQAKGHLLFIDEAYSLLESREAGFGDEAINTIVQEMENQRDDTIVIFAGYPKEMERFLSRNPGLRSRVPFKISFKDYSAEEMVEIARLEAKRKGFGIREDAIKKLTDICEASLGDAASGNGRLCRNLVENAILSYASRVYGDAETSAARDFILAAEDFSGPDTKAEKHAPIGFCA